MFASEQRIDHVNIYYNSIYTINLYDSMLEIEDASVISVFLMDLIYTYITRTPIVIIWNMSV